MFSTRLHQEVQGFDEIIDVDASDFEQSGLKTPSVVRVARLAVVSDEMLLGSIGAIGEERLHRIREKLADWIQGAG
jgi:mRNA interferase MazF